MHAAFKLNSAVCGVLVRATSAFGFVVVVTSATAAPITGTLKCEASVSGPTDPAFVVPVRLSIDGTTLTWTREATGMREVVTAPISNGVAVLDGYGGSVSANTRQAFWDWRLQGKLTVAASGVTGDVQLLSKDGKTVQRRCNFASTSLTPSPTAAATPPNQVPASTPTPMSPPTAVAATAPNLPSSTPPSAAAAVSPQPAVQADGQSAAMTSREDGLRQREEALARRERSVTRRERAIVQPAKPAVASTTSAAPATPSKPIQSTTPSPAAPPQPTKTPAAATLGDI